MEPIDRYRPRPWRVRLALLDRIEGFAESLCRLDGVN
jgi:hypothetical protein